MARKTAYYWHKNRHEKQWNRIEDQDMNPYNHALLIFDKVPKEYHGEKEGFFNKCCWQNWNSACMKRETRPMSSTLYKY
jgi:hypothetical protein